jgi:hypothetical protein
MLGLTQSQQQSTKRPLALQVKRTPCLLAEAANAFPLAALPFNVAEVKVFQIDRRGGFDGLHRWSFDNRKNRSQCRVPANNLSERCLKRFYVERPHEAQRSRNVVDRALWVQLVQEPQALLRKRRREDRRSFCWSHRRVFCV